MCLRALCVHQCPQCPSVSPCVWKGHWCWHSREERGRGRVDRSVAATWGRAESPLLIKSDIREQWQADVVWLQEACVVGQPRFSGAQLKGNQERNRGSTAGPLPASAQLADADADTELTSIRHPPTAVPVWADLKT